MNGFQKSAATVATLALMLPGAALAKGKPDKPAKAKAPSAQADAPASSGKAGAPGQVCKSLKVKGKKTAEQRAAYKKCIKDAVAKRKAEHAAEAKDDAAAPVVPVTPAVTPAP